MSLFKYASAELRKDRKWVESVVRKTWRALEFVDDELKGDRTIVLAAVRQSGHAMRFASEKMRNDKEIVLAVLAAHPEDSDVCAESCRGIARQCITQPLATPPELGSSHSAQPTPQETMPTR